MNNEFKTIEKKVIYKNNWLKLCQHKIIRGGKSGVYTVVERANSVIIIPLSYSGRTVLLRQYRFPTGNDSWELPMGSVEPGETYINAAHRELAEETGITGVDVTQIGIFNPVPGLSPQEVYVFVAKIQNSRMESLEQPKAVDDIQELSVLALEQVYAMAHNGIITDGYTLTSLLLLRLSNL
ncbi:MAG: NUDIX hydrolase [candidate division Zixibacteria bacterium]|nr:NUDIX hydrolase [candidate division Zixibacteria bacterium]